MLFAVPGVEEVVVDVAELITDTECCDDDGCGEGQGHQCPQSCAHGCCVHPTALPPVPQEVAATHFVKPEASFELVAFEVDLAEHRAPPFRPPAC